MIQIRPIEDITKLPSRENDDPSTLAVFIAAVKKMAALTERLQITGPVVDRVMIEMRRRSHDLHLRRWGLKGDHAMVVPSYAEEHSTLAKATGLR